MVRVESVLAKCNPLYAHILAHPFAPRHASFINTRTHAQLGEWCSC